MNQARKKRTEETRKIKRALAEPEFRLGPNLTEKSTNGRKQESLIDLK